MLQNLIIPKVGTSDLEVNFLSSLTNGEFISKGDIYCEIETSKSNFEIECEFEGYIYYLATDNQQVSIGSTVAFVSDNKLTTVEFSKIINDLAPSKNFVNGDVIGSKKALKYLENEGIDPKSLQIDFITYTEAKNYVDRIKMNDVNLNEKFNKDDVIIIGNGGHASQCLEILSNLNYNLKGYVADIPRTESPLAYYGDLSSLSQYKNKGLKNVVIGIGFLNNLKGRQKLFNKLHSEYNIITLIHNDAIVSSNSTVGKGVQIMAGAIVGPNVIIEDNVIINSGAIISHDTIIRHSAHITPGAILAGNVEIGERSLIGMGATVFVGMKLDSDSKVLNGEVVIPKPE